MKKRSHETSGKMIDQTIENDHILWRETRRGMPLTQGHKVIVHHLDLDTDWTGL
jgi:hypothetical protein